jgi:hypothetical protein
MQSSYVFMVSLHWPCTCGTCFGVATVSHILDSDIKQRVTF